jgi:hypothetical protein
LQKEGRAALFLVDASQPPILSLCAAHPKYPFSVIFATRKPLHRSGSGAAQAQRPAPKTGSKEAAF